ncbi:MAG: 1-deoxy-D-xylulose-5-phosphate synthase [Bacillales bacterium]|nr:1-deoxy-D-xylulose-5-phosphate synthase [Bacillales bacterium]
MEINENIDLSDALKSIQLKEMTNEELVDLSNHIREYIIDNVAKNGGHLASNLGIVELTLAIYKTFDLPKDKLLFDVGHQCYTHKILSGRSLKKLRQEGGTDGFQRRDESEYDYFEAGHSSTSISSAMGIALARDVNNQDYEIIDVIGDSSIANGLAFEALNNLLDFKHKLIIIINDNKMSIAKPVGAFNKMFEKIRNTNDKSLFEFLGCDVIPNVDGHSFVELQNALNKAKTNDKTTIIHVNTIKGKGYKYINEFNVSSWHSVKPFDKDSGIIHKLIGDNEILWSSVYSKLLETMLIEDEKSLLIAASTTIPSGIENLFIKYPYKTKDVGIAEEHAVTFASGYALSGNHAYVSMYSSFLQRTYDQINHDIARNNGPVTFLIDKAGLVGSDGESHQGIFDESFLLNMPNVAIAMAKDNVEAEDLFKFARNYSHPLAIRYPFTSTKIMNNPHREVTLGKWYIEKEANDKKIAVISVGPKTNVLSEKLNNITLIHALFVKPMDEKVLSSLLDYENIIVYDCFGITEGFPFHVQNKLLEMNYKGRIKLFGLPNAYIKKGTIEDQEKRYKLDIQSFISYIKSI